MTTAVASPLPPQPITPNTTTPNSKNHRQIPIVCPGHTRPLAELDFITLKDEDESRTFLLSACHDKMPMLRDATTGDWIGTFMGHKGAVWSCKLDPLGLLAGTASGDFNVKVWDAITGSELFTFPHKHIVKTLDFSGDSTRLATGGHEGILRVYELQSPEKLPLEIHQRADKKIVIPKVLWLNPSTILAAGSDGSIRFWDISGDTPRILQTLTVAADVRDMELKLIQSTGQNILTVAAGDKVYIFDLTNGAGELLKEHKMPIHFRDEGGVSLHPSMTKFVAGGSDLWVRVFDFETGEQLECHKGHHGPVRCVRYAPGGKTYATGSEDGTIRLWRTDL